MAGDRGRTRRPSVPRWRVLLAAISYRPGQAVAAALLSALFAACITVAPLLLQTLHDASITPAVTHRHVAATALSVTGARTWKTPDVDIAMLRRAVPPAAAAVHHRGVETTSSTLVFALAPSPARPTSPRLIGRSEACEHVRVVVGRCPAAPGEILVGAPDARRWGLSPGRVVRVRPGLPQDTGYHAGEAARAVPLRVVGAYEQPGDDPYWFGERIDGRSGSSLSDEILLDHWLTLPATIVPTWPQVEYRIDHAVDPSALSVGSLAAATSAVSSSPRPAEIRIRSGLPAVSNDVARAGADLRIIVPLLSAQVALLGVTALWTALASAAEQRRPEVGLSRIRGARPSEAGWTLAAELGIPVLLGLPLGIGLAFLAVELHRRTALPPGVEIVVGPTAWAAMAVAAALVALVVALATLQLVRAPVAGLLARLTPPRRPGGAMWLVVVAAGVGAAAVIGGGGGALALSTPTLVALAVGLVLSRALAAAGTRLGSAALRRGRPALALGALSLGRRSRSGRIVVVTTVATALVVVAVSTVRVGATYRQARAEHETGAGRVLLTDARDLASVAGAIRAADPGGTRLSPVAVLTPDQPNAPRVLAVDPARFAAVAHAEPGVTQALARVAAPQSEPVGLRGNTLGAMVSGGLVPPVPVEVSAGVTMPDGSRVSRPLGRLAPDRARGAAPTRLAGPLLCPRGCRLDSLQVRALVPDGATGPVRGVLHVDLTLDGRSLRLGEPAGWRPPDAASGDENAALAAGPGGLTIRITTAGGLLTIGRADLPGRLPALRAGAPGGAATDRGTEPDLRLATVTGAPDALDVVADVPALPRLGTSGILLDLPTLTRVGGHPAVPAAVEVWARAGDDAALASARTALADRKIAVLEERTSAQARQRLDDSATVWGLGATLGAGVLGVLLSALVVVVTFAATWRATARDLSALRVAGLRRAPLRRAVLGEHLALVLLGVVAGTAAGLAGGALAMPLLPLAGTPSPWPHADLTPPWALVGMTAGLVLLALGACAAGGALALARRAVPTRVRESW